MKTDIIACYYQQAHRLPTFDWGIKANQESIGDIYVVSDGPYDLSSPYPYKFLWHPKCKDHGVGVSFNQGAYESKADFIFFIGIDLILQPGAVSAALSRVTPHTLVIGAVDSIAEDTELTDLPNPTITEIDMDDRNERFKLFGGTQKAYYLARNGHTLVHRETFLALGGFDERFASAGYGYEDYEFGLRFQKAFGPRSIVRSGGRAWHFEKAAPIESRERKRPSDASLKLFLQAELGLHDGRISLFEDKTLMNGVSVGHLTKDTLPDRKATDCNDLTWLPPYSLTHISTRPLQADNPRKHVLDCWGKLISGGTLHLKDVTDDRLLDDLGDIAFIDPEVSNLVVRKML